MTIDINTTNAAINASLNLRKLSGMGTGAMVRLSSGLRINSAKDDAAGLAIVSRFDSRVRNMNVAMRNTNDGISLSQTAESYLSSIQGNLQRMRELAVQSRTGTLVAEDRTVLDKEFKELASEVSRTVDTAKLNGVSLFDGSAASLDIQVGVGTTANDLISIATPNLGTLNAYGTLDILDATNADTAITALGSDLEIITDQRATFGATQSRLESAVDGLASNVADLETARGRILDADFAWEIQKIARSQILQQAGMAILTHANQQPQSVLRLLRS